MLAKNALEQHRQVGADALAHGPVNGDTVATSSRAMLRSVSSPSTFTALSLVSIASQKASSSAASGQKDPACARDPE